MIDDAQGTIRDVWPTVDCRKRLPAERCGYRVPAWRAHVPPVVEVYLSLKLGV